jgi:hypothetical protein
MPGSPDNLDDAATQTVDPRLPQHGTVDPGGK